MNPATQMDAVMIYNQPLNSPMHWVSLLYNWPTNTNKRSTTDASAVTTSTCIQTERFNYRPARAQIIRSVLRILVTACVIQKRPWRGMAQHANGAAPVSAPGPFERRENQSGTLSEFFFSSSSSSFFFLTLELLCGCSFHLLQQKLS